jgi:Tfp pilus assembly protein PilF
MYRFFISAIIFLLYFVFGCTKSEQEILSAIVKKVEPAVVIIQDTQGIAYGNGFFINENGDVITNWHMFHEIGYTKVKASNGNVYSVTKVIAEDEEHNLIRIAVDIPQDVVRPVSLRYSPLKVGEPIYVVDSPLWTERSASSGVISAFSEAEEFGEVVQITAPILVGSIGSPVVNKRGEVIGIVVFRTDGGSKIVIPVEKIAILAPDVLSIDITDWLSSEGLYQLGLLLYSTRDYKGAISYLKNSIKKNPRNAEALFRVGCCYDRLGRYYDAMKSFKRVLLIKPDDVRAYNNLGLAYDGLERYNEAIEAYKQAIHIKSDVAEAYCNLGMTYGKLGRNQEAIEYLDHAVRIKPDYAEAHCNLGFAYLQLGDETSAYEEYRILENLNPELANRLFNQIQKWRRAR